MESNSLIRSKGALVEYGAALWALIFAAMHVAWAAGWYVGLPKEVARKSFQRTWFLVYDLVVAGMCALAVLVALALVRQWGRRLPRGLLSALLWSGTGLLVLRSGGALAQTAFLVTAGRYTPDLMHLYEIWFCLGAILFGLSAWRFRRVSRTGI